MVLLPIFFGILGGLAMYFIVCDDNKQMVKNSLILNVILSIVELYL